MMRASIERESKHNPSFHLLKPLCAALVAAGSLTLASMPASAIEFQLGADIAGSLEVAASYSAGWRMEDRDDSILNPNNDEGDRAFGDKGQMTSSLFKVVYDLGLKKSVGADSTLGFFNRGMGFYDDQIKSADNHHNSPFSNGGNPFFGGSLDDLNTFTEATQDRAGAEVKWLDAYVFFNGQQSTQNAYTIRAGSQVINWGESLFIQSGISNAINPADVTQANLPGTEVKEILLPQRGLYGSLSLTQNLSIESYYQWQWEHTIAPPVGTFLSTNDFIAEDGGETLLLPAPPAGPPGVVLAGTLYSRGDNIDASDSGQYGLALRWYAEALNDTEFGFYRVNYHSKLPSLALAGTPAAIAVAPTLGIIPPVVGPGTYHIEYFDDITLSGLSFNTVLFDIAFSGEIAYHQDFPLQTIAVGPGAIGQAAALGGAPLSLSTREDLIVTQLTVNHSFNTTPIVRDLANDVALLVEFGYVHTPDLDDGEVFRGPTPVDSDAWGVKSRLMLTYYDKLGKLVPALSGTDLIVGFLYNHDVEGTSVIPAGSFTEGTKSAAISVLASWHSTIELEMRYNAFFGDDASGLTDRDNATLTFKYRF